MKPPVPGVGDAVSKAQRRCDVALSCGTAKEYQDALQKLNKAIAQETEQEKKTRLSHHE